MGNKTHREVLESLHLIGVGDWRIFGFLAYSDHDRKALTRAWRIKVAELRLAYYQPAQHDRAA